MRRSRLAQRSCAKQIGVGLVAAALTWLAAPQRAHADDDVAIAVTSVSVGSSLLAANIAFTAYTAGKVADRQEPSQSWMIAQTVVTGAETLGVNGLAVALGVLDDDEEGLELAPLPFAIWTGGLTIFSTWSLARPGETDLQTRAGLSFLAATNLAFTSTAVGALADGEHAPYYISIPEACLMAPQAVLTAVQASRDDAGRPGWIALSAWSSLLTVHGVVSVIGRAMNHKPVEYNIEPPPQPLPTPPAQPLDPYYIDPTGPTPAAPPPPATPPNQPVPRPVVVPAPIPGGASLGPGLMMLGVF